MANSQNGTSSRNAPTIESQRQQLIPAGQGQRSQNAEQRYVNAINRLHNDIAGHFAAGLRRGLYSAFSIGVIVKRVQDAAPQKAKTAAVATLSQHPEMRLSKAQLYRYLRLVRKLPQALGIEPEKFLTMRKNEFLDLVENLSLSEAWALIAPSPPTRMSESLAIDQTTDSGSRNSGGPTLGDHIRLHDPPSAILLAVAEYFSARRILKPESQLRNDLVASVDPLSIDATWTGNIFLNPPLDCILPLVERLIMAVTCGEAEEAVVFVPAVMDSTYAGPLQPYVKAFLRERPVFSTTTSKPFLPPTPYMLVLVSREPPSLSEFAESFGHLADIYYPHRF